MEGRPGQGIRQAPFSLGLANRGGPGRGIGDPVLEPSGLDDPVPLPGSRARPRRHVALPVVRRLRPRLKFPAISEILFLGVLDRMQIDRGEHAVESVFRALPITLSWREIRFDQGQQPPAEFGRLFF